MILPRRTGKDGLLVVTRNAVDRGEWQDTLKPSSADVSGLTRLRHLMLYDS